MCTLRKRKRGTELDLCLEGRSAVANLILMGRSNDRIREYLQENSHIHNLSPAWFAKMRSSDEVEDLFSSRTLESVQKSYSSRARRLDVLNAGVDAILSSMGIKLLDANGEFNMVDIKRSIDEEISRRERVTDDPTPMSISGSIIDLISEIPEPDFDAYPKSSQQRARDRREQVKAHLCSWEQVRALLNQIRIEMEAYEGNVRGAQQPTEVDVEAMAEDIAKRRLYAILEAMEEQVKDDDVMVVPVQRSITS